MYDEAEVTVFEATPFGARQRLLPSRTLVERLRTAIPRQPAFVEVEVAPPPPLLAPAPLVVPVTYPKAPSTRRARRIAIAAVTTLALGLVGVAFVGDSEAGSPERTAAAIAVGTGVTAPTKPAAVHPTVVVTEITEVTEVPEVELAPVAMPTVRHAAQKRPRPVVTVDAATPLGQLRPKRW
jgi:hypothetical protein